MMSAEKEPTTSPSTGTTPPKYSRYRSLRRAAHAEPDPPAQPPQDDKEKQEEKSAVSRSMSRYRRSRAVSKADQFVASPPVPRLPQMPMGNAGHSASMPTKREQLVAGVGKDIVRRVTEPVEVSQSQQREVGDRFAERQTQTRPREPNSGRRRDPEQHRLRQEPIQISAREREEQERFLEQQRAATEAEQARLTEEEATRILAEQKRKDLERLEAELEAAAPLRSPRVASPARDKFSFFSRKRGLTRTTPPPTAGSGSGNGSSKSLARPRTRSNEPPNGMEQPRIGDPPRLNEQPRIPEEPRNPKPSQVIEQGGGGIVPQTDAPISAVNAGERRVLIRCKQSSINLPITPETTPVDLIYSAANVMTVNISTSTAILLESYTQLGLERRIRRYEHIRDVMNSWDRDTQNVLMLENSDSPKFDTDLETSSVPKEAPGDVTVYMYHSQKPGKWTKRYITLMSTGQVFISKKAGAKPSAKDSVNICHLSDFDIYTPTPQQLRKTLKPPKKHCYAIKSQQKTTMFLNTENFVHFFNTDDEILAEKWYAAVQRWRSWYLVTQMGEGKKTKRTKATTTVATELPARPGTKAGPTHKVKVSVDENPYTIGSFQPLLNMDRFDQPPPHDPPEYDGYDSEEENRPRQIPFHLRNSVSLSPIPSRRESRRHPPPVSYRLPPEAEDEFASSSLLGRTYTIRQKMQKERDAQQTNQPPSAFVEGPSLINGSAHQRTMSMNSTRMTRPETSAGPGNSGGLQRGTSQMQKPKPLIDFTPQFKEAPQWDRTHKGHGVRPVEGVPLVDIATGPQVPEIPGLPVNTIFRRDQAAARPMTAVAVRAREGAFVEGGLVSGMGNGGNRGRMGYD